MDSEAKGQLGGMDCTEGTRRTMAGESRRWRCAGCGRSNEEILGECMEAARKKEDEGETRKEEEVVVPEELRLAYRDELGRTPETQSQEQAPIAPSNTSNPPPASAGATRGPPAIDPTSITTSSSPAPPSCAAQPAQTIPRPTRTIPALPSPPAPWHPRALRQPSEPAQVVPAWIDKAILGIAVSLVVMVFKKFIYI